MKKLVLTAFASAMILLCAGCGLQIFQDWQNSDGKAMVGGGAVAGADYVNGLLPSEGAKKYFAKIPVDQAPIETVSLHDDVESKTGVRFVKNGGIVIPPGVTISYTNKGYCMDPHLPAPVANEEYQLVPMTRLIPPDLQGTYKKLLTKAANGDQEVRRNMQHLIWALRTAGSKDAYANNLTPAQKKILDRCSDYQGQFEEYHINSRKNQEQWGALLGLADTVLNVQIGGVTYKASDLLDPEVGSKKINAHIDQLISMGKSTPIERTGLNFGEIQPGIYTDVRGAGVLAYTAKIANSTNKDFIFYPQDYVGQVGSGTKSQGLSFFATANNGQRQRVTTDTDEVKVENEEEDICVCSEIIKKRSEIHQKHAWRYHTVTVCRCIQNGIYMIPGLGEAIKFFYKSLHGDYDSYSEAALDAASGYFDKVLKIDFNLISGTDIGNVASAIDYMIWMKDFTNSSIGIIEELKQDFAKIDRIIQNEINNLPKCPVHSK